MGFSDLLKQPLPSALNNSNYDNDDGYMGGMNGYDDGCDDGYCNHSEEDRLNGNCCQSDNDYDYEDEYCDHDEEDRLNGRCCQYSDGDDNQYPIYGATPDSRSYDGDDAAGSPLTPEQSQRVDDTMNTVATPMLLADELGDDDINEFVESVDSDIAVTEGFLTEKTIVRFDKNAKRAQLYEIAVASVAREKNDPLWHRLEKTYEIERTIKAKLRKKYHSQATMKVKEYLKRASKSKSGVLSKIANKILKK